MLVNKLPVGSLTLNNSQRSLRQKSTFFFFHTTSSETAMDFLLLQQLQCNILPTSSAV